MVKGKQLKVTIENDIINFILVKGWLPDKLTGGLFYVYKS